MRYRKVSEIGEEEFLAALKSEPQTQASIFVALGGDPKDHNYARLSWLTKRLREKGHRIASSRQKGIWLEEAAA